MWARGFVSKEVLLAILVVVAAGAAVIPMWSAVRAKESADVDVERMRKLYLTLAVYESGADLLMPPTLLPVVGMIEPEALTSVRDPLTEGEHFPVDAGLPEWRVESPVRISFSYVYSYVAAGREKVAGWNELKMQPEMGFLANEWQGRVEPGADFQATVSGKVLRLNTDGALYPFTRETASPLGNFQDLFVTR